MDQTSADPIADAALPLEMQDEGPQSERTLAGDVVSDQAAPNLGEAVDREDEFTPKASDVAASILKWAKQHRLFTRQPVDDPDEVNDENEEPAPQPAMMFASTQVETVLRRRAINMIVFNDLLNKVVIYTKANVTAADHKIVPYADKGVTIEYAVGGSPTVKGTIPQTHASHPYHFHNGLYCCGSSVFPGNCMGAGTMGFLARDESGKLFGVTNNHVTGACNNAAPGLPILAPGPLDIVENSIEPFCIGRHSRLIAINDGIPENVDISDNLDACCFEIVDGAPVTSMQGNLCDTPSDVADPLPGMIVEKVGRTTGYRRGKIVGQSIAPLAVGYVVNEYKVQKTVYFKTVFVVEGLQEPFSLRGDSGSLVMSIAPDGTRQSVGVVFAGDDKRALSYILPISEFLRKLSLELCTGLNV